MSKGSKNSKVNKNNAQNKSHDKAHEQNVLPNNYLFSMSHAPGSQESAGWVQMLPVMFFTAAIILITRMATYERPMEQFFFWSGDNKLNDFFSYYKMVAILVFSLIALILILYRVFIQSLYIKRSYVYIPMLVYSVLVLLSYLFSDYKEFALWGWNDRFEGTLVLISYMFMLFYVINTINSEKNVKSLIYTLVSFSALLSILGLSQALGHDFFRTVIGKKLITPSWFWDQIDNLNFTFQNNEIYQTVYNINYVSFYLTLIIPIFGMLFIRSVMAGGDESLYKKILWGVLFALLIYNLIGSASSGGLMGMAVVILIALIVLNKRIFSWWKPVVILLAITIIIGGVSYDRWLPELSKAIDGVNGTQTKEKLEKNAINHKIDFIETDGDAIVLGYQGSTVIFRTYPEDPSSLSVSDGSGQALSLKPVSESPYTFEFEDQLYSWITVRPAKDDKGKSYIILTTDGHEWPFLISDDGIKYLTGSRKLVDLHKVQAVGWEENQSFGTGRGYIWSRTLPLIQDTLILGHGADTYCIYFPHEDYVGKYNSGTFSNKINIIVDKPHNMYLGSIIGTGGLSVLTLIALWGIYLVQSFRLYRKTAYRSFLSYAGSGIFLGICGFLVSGLVNDSSVSVMPMFYGLLGTGISVNMMLKREHA